MPASSSAVRWRVAHERARKPQVIGAGFSLLPNDNLLITGSVGADVDRVSIRGRSAPIELTPFTDRPALLLRDRPAPEHEIIATEKDGRELGRTSIEPEAAAAGTDTARQSYEHRTKHSLIGC